jgi:hypothetical protein
MSAASAPTPPVPNVQVTSTQPELPVRCCINQAPVIAMESATAIIAVAAMSWTRLMGNLRNRSRGGCKQEAIRDNCQARAGSMT